MSKNKAIQDKLESRSPATMRQLIKPVDMLESEQKQPEQTNEQTNKRTNEQTDGHPSERTRVRHSFDIFQDQLDDLREFALRRQKTTRKRVLLGDLVQEALDLFIERERMNERSNERPNG